MLKSRPVLAAILALGLPFAAYADMTEADRLARCANNKEAIETLRAELKANPDFKSDGEITDLRSELRTLDRARRLADEVAKCNETKTKTETDKYGDPMNDSYRECLDKIPSLSQDDRVRTINILQHYGGQSKRDMHELYEVYEKVNRLNDRAMAARPRLIEINNEIAFHQSRMEELRCSSAPDKTPPRVQVPDDDKKTTGPSSETAGACGIGRRWQVKIMHHGTENGAAVVRTFSHVWTREGDSDLFHDRDADGGINVDQIVSLNGDQVTARLTDDRHRQGCTYQGTLQGRTIIKGTYKCNFNLPVPVVWGATVECQ